MKKYHLEDFGLIYIVCKKQVSVTRKWYERKLGTRVKKTSLGETLAESHAYSPIRDSGETLGEREKSHQESCRESHQSLTETLDETSCETFGETFSARQASPHSLGSDYMHGSAESSFRDSFFYAVMDKSITKEE